MMSLITATPIVMIMVAMTLTLKLLTTIIVAPPSNASKWQMGFNSAFQGLKTIKCTTPNLLRMLQYGALFLLK